jgi:hypothetical protein
MGEVKDDKGEAAAASTEQAEHAREAQETFERGVIERGEAAEADAEGRLPPGATHEIVGYDATGRPILKRRRFSAF